MEIRLFGAAECLGKEIRYFLLAEQGSWGIAVEYGGESVWLPGLTAERSRAEELLRAMARGQVTPVTARDVASDFFLQFQIISV